MEIIGQILFISPSNLNELELLSHNKSIGGKEKKNSSLKNNESSVLNKVGWIVIHYLELLDGNQWTHPQYRLYSDFGIINQLNYEIFGT